MRREREREGVCPERVPITLKPVRSGMLQFRYTVCVQKPDIGHVQLKPCHCRPTAKTMLTVGIDIAIVLDALALVKVLVATLRGEIGGDDAFRPPRLRRGQWPP